MSPIARSTNDAPSTRPPIPYTTRVFSVTCAATSVTPANTSPNSVNESPNATRPGDGQAERDERERHEHANGDVHRARR